MSIDNITRVLLTRESSGESGIIDLVLRAALARASPNLKLEIAKDVCKTKADFIKIANEVLRNVTAERKKHIRTMTMVGEHKEQEHRDVRNIISGYTTRAVSARTDSEGDKKRVIERK